MEYLELMFGEGITLAGLLVFLTIGVFGIVMSMLIDIYSSGIAFSEFSWKKWISDNGSRIILSFLVLILAIAFAEELTGIERGNWSMFIAGFTSDKIIENLAQRRRRKKDENK